MKFHADKQPLYFWVRIMKFDYDGWGVQPKSKAINSAIEAIQKEAADEIVRQHFIAYIRERDLFEGRIYPIDMTMLGAPTVAREALKQLLDTYGHAILEKAFRIWYEQGSMAKREIPDLEKVRVKRMIENL